MQPFTGDLRAKEPQSEMVTLVEDFRVWDAAYVRPLYRLVCCIALAAASILAPASSAFGQSHSRSSTQCLNNSNDCRLVIGQMKVGATQLEVSRFLQSLINPDGKYLPLGKYGIHGCSSPGQPTNKVTCFLWPSAPKTDLVKLEATFKKSKLFRLVSLKIPSQ